jgi:hypothetical protein
LTSSGSSSKNSVESPAQRITKVREKKRKEYDTKPRIIPKPPRGVTSIFNGRSYYENRFAVGVYGMANEKDPEFRKEIAKDTVRYVHEAGGIGEPWSEERYGEVMKREAEGKYKGLKPKDCRALNIFIDILYGGNLAAEHKARWDGAWSNFFNGIQTRDEKEIKVDQKLESLLCDLTQGAMNGIQKEIGTNPSRWVSRALLYSAVPHLWNHRFHAMMSAWGGLPMEGE